MAAKHDPRYDAESEYGGTRGMILNQKKTGGYAQGRRALERMWPTYGAEPFEGGKTEAQRLEELQEGSK